MDKSPFQPNTLLGKVIEKENRFMKVVTKFGIMDTWIACAPNRLQIPEDMNELIGTTKTISFNAVCKKVRTKTTKGQYSPVRLELARLVSSLLYGFLINFCFVFASP